MDVKPHNKSNHSHDGSAHRDPARKAPHVETMEPFPVPQAIEGNSDTDWARWEDSVAFQDSQHPPEFTDSRAKGHEPAQPQSVAETDFDPFGSVSRNGS